MNKFSSIGSYGYGGIGSNNASYMYPTTTSLPLTLGEASQGLGLSAADIAKLSTASPPAASYNQPLTAGAIGTNAAQTSGTNPDATQDALADAAKSGFNWSNAGDIMKGIASLGSVWAGIQANKISREQLNLSRTVGQANLDGSVDSYNTRLAQLANVRRAYNGMSQEETDRWVRDNSMERRTL